MPSDYANDLMARVGLDTTEWKKGITDLNSGIKHIETGFQATAALMDDWGSSSEGLKKRVESLNDKLALQKQKLEMLKKAYEEEVEKSGASSRASQNLAKQMYAAANEINRTKASVESYSNKLNELGKDTEWKKTLESLDAEISHIETSFKVSSASMDDWSSSSEGVQKRVDTLNEELSLQKKKLDTLTKAYEEEIAANGESSETAQELEKEMRNVSDEINRTKASVEKYSSAEDEATKKTKAHIAQLEKSGKTLQEVGSKISSVGDKMTLGITTPVVAAGAAIYNYSSDLTEAVNKADATFGLYADDIQDWSKNALDNMGMARQTALDAVSLYGDMATSMGLTQKEAASMSKELVSLSADLSSFKNVSLDTSQGALKGIFTGETESLKNLGIVMTETELKAYAMSKGFEKNYADMTQAEKVQLRYEFVLDKSANAIGDYGKTSEEAAGQMRKLPEALKELAASFRDNVEPAITPVVSAVNGALVAFGKMDNGTKQTAVNISLCAAALGPLVSVTGKTITIFGKAKSAVATFRSWMLKKTQATKTATTAEATHSRAMTTTGNAATGAASKVSKFGSKLESALPVIALVVLALEGLRDAYDDAKEAMEEDINSDYDKQLEAAEELYKTESKHLQDQIDAENTAYADSIESAQKAYDEKTKQAEEYVEKELKGIETVEKAEEKAHKNTLKRLEAERDAQLELIDISTNKATSALQEQIDAIDSMTAAEDKAEKEREDAAKLAELQQNILNAGSLTEREEAQKEYSEFVAELEREKTLNAREEQKQRLQDEIDRINAEADAQREKVNSEYEIAREEAENKYEIFKEGIDNQREYLSGYVESEREAADAIQNSAEETAKNIADTNIKEFQRMLDEREKAYEQSLKDIETARDEALDDAKVSLQQFINELLTPDGLTDIASVGVLGAGTIQMAPFAMRDVIFSGMGSNASGTDNWRGGLTRINELGGEIVNLPRGTQIIPHDVSMEMARSYGRQAAITNSTTNNYSTTETTNNNYASQQRVTNFNIAGHRVGTIIEPEVSEIAAMRAKQRRRAGRAY